MHNAAAIRRHCFSLILEKDIKDNAEDITKNTVQITSLRGDVDEAVEIANGVSARVDGLAEQVTEIEASVTG